MRASRRLACLVLASLVMSASAIAGPAQATGSGGGPDRPADYLSGAGGRAPVGGDADAESSPAVQCRRPLAERTGPWACGARTRPAAEWSGSAPEVDAFVPWLPENGGPG